MGTEVTGELQLGQVGGLETGSPGAGVTGSCELFNMSAENYDRPADVPELEIAAARPVRDSLTGRPFWGGSSDGLSKLSPRPAGYPVQS